jgi:hypothetical protein
MALPTIRRRVGRLETVFVVDPFAGCPPLTMIEIEALAGRLADGGAWTDEEEARVARQCPIIQGELLITAIRGEVFVKRYLGVDLASI